MKGKIIKTPKNATPTTRRTSRLFRFLSFSYAFKWLSNAVFNIIFGEKFVN